MTTKSAATQVAPAKSPSTKPDQPLPLEPGDHLTRAEFERRYHSMPEVKKAELIEGVVYMPSPVRHKSHGKPHGKMMTWLGVYSAAKSETDFSDNTTLRLDQDNEPQPDGVLRIDEAHGGRSRVTEDDYLEGSPELIVEIASSSASYDLREKLNVYRRNGVQEYIVWRVYDEQIDWFSLQDEQYVLLHPNEDGIVESRVFPGLRLKVAAMLSGDLATVLAALNEPAKTEITT
ncbi:MAG: Uma2 family endonuclease [Acidobacteria bacterium]|nr:Uma2 family endonuclease [Acidobacteriota bacterium]